MLSSLALRTISLPISFPPFLCMDSLRKIPEVNFWGIRSNHEWGGIVLVVFTDLTDCQPLIYTWSGMLLRHNFMFILRYSFLNNSYKLLYHSDQGELNCSGLFFNFFFPFFPLNHFCVVRTLTFCVGGVKSCPLSSFSSSLLPFLPSLPSPFIILLQYSKVFISSSVLSSYITITVLFKYNFIASKCWCWDCVALQIWNFHTISDLFKA